jgi:P4 family phage/plasmid primase-like protien
MGIYRDCAPQYIAKGLIPLPIRPGSKAPIVTGWQNPEAFDRAWVTQYADCGIGLLLGTEVSPGLRLIAVDIDSEEYVERVEKAIGVPCPTKIGKKGETLFVLHPDLKNTKMVKDGRPLVEFLAAKSQTVLPPTIHPDSKQPYRWVGKPLLEWDDIPRLTSVAFGEIEAHAKGGGTHFDALNSMACGHCTPGGGNSHDACVAAVGSLVAKKWTDVDITARVQRAKREACERNGKAYHWPEEGRTIAEWIRSARDKGMAETGRKIPMERLMATWALGYLGGPDLVKTENGVMRRYQDGHWPPVTKETVRQKMFDQEPSLRNRESKDAIDVLATITDVGERFGHSNGMRPADDPKRQRVCLLNGTLNLRTGELESWDPRHEIRHQLPFEWQDEVGCPLYEQTVDLVFGGDKHSITVWDEFCALTLVDDMSFQKMLFLRGSGGNGKSTLAQVLRYMHDPDAVASVAITELDNERKRSSLLGKLLNISTEQSRLNNISDAYLKKITGGDPVDIRFLYREVRNNIRLSVRFLELVNEMPSTADQSEAFQRRLMILTCPYKFEKPIPDFYHKLLAERPGILRRWVEALKILYARGRFDEPKSSGEAIREYILDNDPVRKWCETRCVKDRKGSPSADLYADYRNWERAMGFQYTTSEPRWSQKMALLGHPKIQLHLGHHYIQGRRLAIKKGMESPI